MVTDATENPEIDVFNGLHDSIMCPSAWHFREKENSSHSSKFLLGGHNRT